MPVTTLTTDTKTPGLHPKVKIPAIALTGLTIILGALAIITSSVPAWAPIASAASTIIQLVFGIRAPNVP